MPSSLLACTNPTPLLFKKMKLIQIIIPKFEKNFHKFVEHVETESIDK